MSGQGSVYKRCGCVDPVTGRQLGTRCLRLAGSRHGGWYVAVELPAGWMAGADVSAAAATRRARPRRRCSRCCTARDLAIGAAGS